MSLRDKEKQAFKEIEISNLRSNLKEDEYIDNEQNNQRVSNMFISQFTAFQKKNLIFQKRQFFSNICQVIIPLLSLLLIWVIKYEFQSNFTEDFKFDAINGVPFYLNIPLSFFSQSSAYPISIKNCNIWFLLKNHSNVDQKYLDEIFKPVFPEFCYQINQYVPRFQNIDTDINQELSKNIQFLNSQKISLGKEVPQLEILPDAAIELNKLEDNKIDFTIQMNDSILTEFHRDNSFSKISFKIPDQDLIEYFKDNIKESFQQKDFAKNIDMFSKAFNLTDSTFPVFQQDSNSY